MYFCKCNCELKPETASVEVVGHLARIGEDYTASRVATTRGGGKRLVRRPRRWWADTVNSNMRCVTTAVIGSQLTSSEGPFFFLNVITSL